MIRREFEVDRAILLTLMHRLGKSTVGGGGHLGWQSEDSLGDRDAAGEFGHGVCAVPPGLERLGRVHDQLAQRVGRIVLLEEGQNLACEGQRGVLQEVAVERVVEVIEQSSCVVSVPCAP